MLKPLAFDQMHNCTVNEFDVIIFLRNSLCVIIFISTFKLL